MKGLISNSSFLFIYDSVVFAVNRNENCKGAFAQRQGFSYLLGVALLSSPHTALLFPSPSESGSVAVWFLDRSPATLGQFEQLLPAWALWSLDYYTVKKQNNILPLSVERIHYTEFKGVSVPALQVLTGQKGQYGGTKWYISISSTFTDCKQWTQPHQTLEDVAFCLKQKRDLLTVSCCTGPKLYNSREKVNKNLH